MAAVPPNVLGWLSNVLSGTYRDSKRTFDDTVQVLSNYRTISPRTDVHTFPNGRSELLLLLSGTIPVTFRGAVYNFPLQIWVPQTYPREPPMIYVTPTESMVVRPGQHVDPSGQVYHPYLVGWAQFWDKSSILDLLTILRDVFAKEPPVAAKQPQPQPPQQAQPTPPPVPQKPVSQVQSPPPQQTPLQQAPPPPPPKDDDYGPAQRHPQATTTPPQPTSTSPPVPPLPPKPGQAPRQYTTSPVQQQYRPGPPQQHYQQGPPQHYYSSGPARQQYGPGPQQQFTPAPLPHKYPSPQQQAHASPRNYGMPAPLSPSVGTQSQPQISTSQGILPQGAYQGPPGAPPGPVHGVIPPQQYASRHPQLASAVPPPQQYTGPAQQRYSGPPPGWNPPPPAQAQPKPKPPPPPDLIDDDITVTIPERADIAPPPIPPNPEKDMLLHQLAETLHKARVSAITNNESSLAGLSAQRKAMLNAQQILQAESQQLNQLSALLQSNANILRSALQQADQVIESSKLHPSPDIDELLVAPTVVANQLYNTVAEEKAIGDAIFVLGKAVERGRIAPTTFVKNTRSLAREWYLKKALAKKIARGMGLLGA